MRDRPTTATRERLLALAVLAMATGAVALALAQRGDAAPLRFHVAEGAPLQRAPQRSAARPAAVRHWRRRPLAGRMMWIWELRHTKRGRLRAIARSAHAHGISTVAIKGGDGRQRWHQLNRRVVRALHRRGVGVCGWQYVYGTHPVGEARVGARIVRNGVDCLIADAESEYEGRPHAARRYVRALRRRIGRRFPLALTTFPYASLHPRFPYRQFLGRGGAQYNLPQVYWRELGDSPRRALRRTLHENRRFGRPILPAGQAWRAPSTAQVRRFELVARKLGAAGVSYWVWQHTTRAAWRALGPRGGLARAPGSIRRRAPAVLVRRGRAVPASSEGARRPLRAPPRRASR